MAETNVPSGTDSDNPADILARISQLTELRLQVDADHTLGVVTVDIAGLSGDYACILAPTHALDLALRLYRVRGAAAQERAGC